MSQRRSPHRPLMRALIRNSRNRGESLIELLITISIIGLTVPAVLGAVMLGVSTSELDERQVQAQSLLTSWAERLAGATYTDCASAAGYEATLPYGSLGLPGLPDGFTPSYDSVRYWSGTSWQASCTTDTGVRRVRLRMAASGPASPAFETTLWVTVRKPCSNPGDCS